MSVARDRLAQKGFIEYRGGQVYLTPRGEAELQKSELRGYVARKPRRWDERWRVLIFDIPEYRKGLRDKMRRTLIAVGFVRLQDSVWVYPYDCEDLITLLKADLRIGKDVLYMVVETLEGDGPLKKHFRLP